MHETINFILPWFPLWLAQIFRGICILIGPVCIILSTKLALRDGLAQPQKFIFAGLTLLFMGSVYTQAERWYAPVTPRLFLETGGTILFAIGLMLLNPLDDKRE